MSTVSQRSFAAGELAPALYARVDTVRYATGARTLRNCYVLRSGGSQNRPGSTFIGEVKDSAKAVRLIPFVFNDAQTYVLEFGDLYMRVIKQGNYVTLTSQAITAISSANPCVVTYAGADTYANGDVVSISGIVGAIGTYLNGRDFKVASVNAPANTFTLQYMDATNVNSTTFGGYTSGGILEEVYTITTPYAVADLPLLQYSQTGDVIAIVHRSYVPQQLARTSDTSWTLSNLLRNQANLNTAATLFSITGGPGSSYYYALTAVGFDGDETWSILQAGTATAATAGTPVTFVWTLFNDEPATWNIYRSPLNDASTFNYIGSVDGGIYSFRDTGVPADLTSRPPSARDLWTAANDYPGVVAAVSQRRWVASTNGKPSTAWATNVGSLQNFLKIIPTTDASSLEFKLVGNRLSEIRHILDLGSPVMLTDTGEYTLEGDGGIVTPSAINPKQSSGNGASYLSPLIVDATALYVQARGSAVRDLNFDIQVDGYRGNDLTITASHLVDGFEITAWAYQKIPHSVAWAVRDDGVLLSLTYVRDQQIIGWARHDFEGGIVEDVCSVPEGTEDAVYVVVQRTINGRSVRYVERFNQRRVDFRNEMVFMDSTLAYDGRNAAVTTMTLTGGTTWAYDETITLTASAAFFASSYVGDEIHLENAAGTELIRCEITAFTSTTVVSVRPNRTVPVAMRSVALSVWARAVDQVGGLWHLEGKNVSILGDGYVVASPNNSSYVTHTVLNGSVNLANCYAVLYVGLPYISDLETLDVDSADGETLADKQKLVNEVIVHLEKSAGLFVGREAPTGTDPLEGLYELKVREFESYDTPTDLVTGTADVTIESSWNSNGRIFIRQVDPLPMAVLAVAPSGFFPFKKR